MLRISHEAYQEILQHARRAYPEEACGVLLREHADDKVTHVVACENRAPERCSRYAIDPAELIRLQREARQGGAQIAGFYHSHPDSAATPSMTDAAEAYWSGCAYVIAGMSAGEVQEVRSFRSGNEGELSEEPMMVSAPTGL